MIRQGDWKFALSGAVASVLERKFILHFKNRVLFSVDGAKSSISILHLASSMIIA